MSKPIAIACDLEFTSFDVIGGDVISAGLVEILEDLTLGRELLIYARPRSTSYFTAAAQEVHGISYWKALTFPEPRQGCLQILHWLKEHQQHFPLGFVFHGTGTLDWKWLKAHFWKEQLEPSLHVAFREDKVESTLALARKNLKQLDDHKLPTIAKHYGIKFKHHSALDDARTCAEIYCRIKKGDKTWTGSLF
jgi:DNA polymerase III epsilon subunit-like protein